MYICDPYIVLALQLTPHIHPLLTLTDRNRPTSEKKKRPNLFVFGRNNTDWVVRSRHMIPTYTRNAHRILRSVRPYIYSSWFCRETDRETDREEAFSVRFLFGFGSVSVQFHLFLKPTETEWNRPIFIFDKKKKNTPSHFHFRLTTLPIAYYCCNNSVPFGITINMINGINRTTVW